MHTMRTKETFISVLTRHLAQTGRCVYDDGIRNEIDGIHGNQLENGQTSFIGGNLMFRVKVVSVSMEPH